MAAGLALFPFDSFFQLNYLEAKGFVEIVTRSEISRLSSSFFSWNRADHQVDHLAEIDVRGCSTAPARSCQVAPSLDGQVPQRAAQLLTADVPLAGGRPSRFPRRRCP